MTYRVLITASRTITDRTYVAAGLLDVWHDATTLGQPVTWVHGDCPRGGDRISHGLLIGYGFTPERHPADWDVCRGPKCSPTHRRPKKSGGTYCPAAGLIRDAYMVALGADLCLAMVEPCADTRCRRPRPHGSHGASETARMARDAGIEVLPWTA